MAVAKYSCGWVKEAKIDFDSLKVGNSLSNMDLHKNRWGKGPDFLRDNWPLSYPFSSLIYIYLSIIKSTLQTIIEGGGEDIGLWITHVIWYVGLTFLGTIFVLISWLVHTFDLQ